MSFNKNKNAILRLYLLLVLISFSIYFVSSDNLSSSVPVAGNHSAGVLLGNASSFVPSNASNPGMNVLNQTNKTTRDVVGPENVSVISTTSTVKYVPSTTSSAVSSSSTLPENKSGDGKPVTRITLRAESFLAGDAIEIHVYANASCDLWIKEPGGWFLALQNHSGDTVYVYSTTVPGNYSVKADCFSGNHTAQAVKGFNVLADKNNSRQLNASTSLGTTSSTAALATARSSTTTTQRESNGSVSMIPGNGSYLPADSLHIITPVVSSEVGGVAEIFFNVSGGENLTIQVADGTVLGEDVSFSGLFCADVNKTGGAYYIADLLSDDIIKAAVPFLLMPISFAYLLRGIFSRRRKQPEKSKRDHRSMLIEYDRWSAGRGDAYRKKSFKSPEYDARVYSLRRPSRDFVGQLLSYDEAIRRSRRPAGKILKDVFYIVLSFSVLAIFFMNMSAQNLSGPALQIYRINGVTYHLLPYGESVNGSYRLVGVYFPNLTCSDMCAAKFQGLKAGNYTLEFSYGQTRESAVIKVVAKPGNDMGGALSIDKGNYSLGESVKISVRPKKMLYDLFLKGPNGWILLLANSSGNIDYEYEPNASGEYTAKVELNSSGMIRELSAVFRVVDTVEETAHVYGHILTKESIPVPNASVRVTCPVSGGSGSGYTDSSGYYIISLSCPPGANVRVDAGIGAGDLCLTPGLCSPYLGGAGTASSLISSDGYSKVDVFLLALQNGSVVISTDKESYSVNETVHVTVSAQNRSCDLWIKEPAGWFLALQNQSEDIDYAYSSYLPGDYEAKASCYLSGKKEERSASFSIFGTEIGNCSISIDKDSYLLNETVNITIRVENLSFDLWIKEPAGWFLALQNYSGSAEYAYSPSDIGRYNVRVECFSEKKSENATAQFSVVADNLDQAFLISASDLAQGPAVVGMPVSWTRRFLIHNPSEKGSEQAVCLEVPPGTYNISLSLEKGLAYNSSCFNLSLKKEESVNVSLLFHTAPVQISVKNISSVKVSDLIPEGALDVMVYSKGNSSGLLEIPVKGRILSLAQNSSLIYKNLSYSILVSGGSESALFSDYSKKDLSNSPGGRNISLTLDALGSTDKTIILRSSIERTQGPAVVGAPVKWTLMIENYSIEYQTAAPLKTEDKPLLEEGKLIKNVSVESNASVHYYNVTSYSDLDTPATSVSLYLLVNDSRLDVTDDPAYAVVPIDLDGDGLYERLQWVVPQLSKKDFLIKTYITVLNVYSHPMIKENWTVSFNTTGSADLTITASNGTRWSNSNESYDLRFLEVRCGEIVLNYSWISGSVFLPKYSCAEVGGESSKVITPGVHNLKFTYGSSVAYAHNFACDSGSLDTNCNITTTQSVSDGYWMSGLGNLTILAGGGLYCSPAQGFTINMTSGFVKMLAGSFINCSVNISAKNFYMESSSKINASRFGYAGGANASGSGPGGGGYNTSGSRGGGGAGFGGTGGVGGNSGGAGGGIYGSNSTPLYMGSGGGSGRGTGNSAGGRGGGLVFINVSNVLSLNGSIMVDGNSSYNNAYGGGGGSGGEVYIIAPLFNGSGSISANGGNGTGTTKGGGGAGGRIACWYCLKTWSGTNTTAYGTGNANGGTGIVNVSVNTSLCGTPATSASGVKSDSSAYTFGLISSSYVNISLSCSPGVGVPCDTTLYCTDSANTCTPAAVYSSPVQVSSQGSTYIRYKSNNTYNNSETVQNKTLLIDTAAPYLNFSVSTEDNGTAIGRNWAQVNISITEPNLDTFKFNWNGTNYTIYDSSLVLALNFNNNSAIGENSTFAVDSSMYGNNGSIMGGAFLTASGRFGGGVSINGTAGYVVVNTSTRLQNYSQKTVMLWFKDNGTQTYRLLLDNGYWASPYGDYIYTPDTSNNMYIYLKNKAGTVIGSPIGYTFGEWTMIGYSWNGTKVNFYKNGLMATQSDFSGTLACSSYDLYLGALHDGSDQLNGTIDEVRIYNRSLSAQEIWLQYQSEFQKYNSTTYRFYTNLTNLTSGSYAYYGWANDTAGNSNYTGAYTASSPRYLTVNLNTDNTPPVLNFTLPTENNGSLINRNWAQLNISVADENLDSFYFDWDYTGADSHLVGNWKLDDDPVHGENSTHAYDYSGSGNNGTIYGATYTAGKKGLGLNFDMADDYVYSGSLGLASASQVTFEAWVKSYYYYDDMQTIVSSLEDESEGTIWLSRISGSSDLGWEYSNGSIAYLMVDAVNFFSGYNGEWVHMAVTADYATGQVKFYRNGEYYYGETMQNPVAPTKNQLWIGSYDSTPRHLFNGSIDEVRVYNTVLSAEQVMQRYRSMRAKYYDDSLVLGMNFNNNPALGEDSHTVADISKYGNNGIAWSSALKFDGIDDYVDLGTSEVLQPVVGSIEAWIKPVGTFPATEVIFTGSAGGSAYRHPYFTLATGGVLTLGLTNNTNWQNYDGPTLESGVWYHVASTWNGTSVSFYVNGQLNKTLQQNMVPVPNSDSKRIGGLNPPDYSSVYNGTIADLRIYNRSLSSAEIAEHYDHVYSDESGLVLNIPFWNSSGEKASDTSVNGNDGTLHGFDDTNEYYGDDHDSGWTYYGRPLYTASGKYGGAYAFNGWNQGVEVPHSGSLDGITDNLTVEAWTWYGGGETYGTYAHDTEYQVGRNAYDANIDDIVRNANTGDGPGNVSIYGFSGDTATHYGYTVPYIYLRIGQKPGTPTDILRVEVWDTTIGKIVANDTYNTDDFPDTENYYSYEVSHWPTYFSLPDHSYKFVVYYYANVDVYIDGLELDRYHKPVVEKSDSWRMYDMGDIEFLVWHPDHSDTLVAHWLGYENFRNWVHIAGTYSSADGLKLYINGGLVESEPANGKTIAQTTSTVDITNGHFPGMVDELRIYNRVLAGDEIRMQYESEFSKYNSTEYRFYANVTDLWNGNYTYYGWAQDAYGSTAQTDNGDLRYLSVDLVAPETEISAVKNDSSGYVFDSWTNSSYVTVSLACVSSDCDKVLYCTDTAGFCMPNTVYSAAVRITTQGKSYIRYRSNDTAGNLEDVKSRVLKIDSTSTSLEYKEPTDESGSTVRRSWMLVNFSISDPSLDSFRLNLNGTDYNVYDDSLVLGYNFNNDSVIGENSTHVIDNSKYGNDGNIYGGAEWTPTGRYGGALQFDGFNDYVSVQDSESLDLSDAATLGMWLRMQPARLKNISAGYFHTCALLVNGSALCWGSNWDGMIGDDTTIMRDLPVYVSGNYNFSAISAGGEHTCGLLSSGLAMCWGYNDDGELGDNTEYDRYSPVAVSGGYVFKSIETGGYHSCGLLLDGSAMCWGWNAYGQLGDGTTDSKHEPTPVSGGHVFSSISLGNYHTCGILLNGSVMCWGLNDYGALGDNSTEEKDRPVYVSGGYAFSAVNLGRYFSCGILLNGSAMCWGYNYYYQLGDGTRSESHIPVAVGGGHAFKEISLGYYTACGLVSDGSAFCWGYGSHGEIGDGIRSSRSSPEEVYGGNAFSALSVGEQDVCGLTTEGYMYCWGDNEYGALGDGTSNGRVYPTLLGGLYDVNVTSLGAYHSCALLNNGSVLCWGYNDDGELGDGTWTDRVMPIYLSGGHAFRSISSGEDTSCGILINGSAMCWGYNDEGEIGDNTTEDRNEPVYVAGGHVFRSIYAGGYQSCGLLYNGSAMCWGYNWYGELGDGSTEDRYMPVFVSGGYNFSSLSLGEEHSCGLLVNGSAMCWGVNWDGELGDGTDSESHVPVAVAGGHVFRSIAVGYYHSCGILLNGSAMCWGYNGDGEVGDGTWSGKLEPAYVIGDYSFSSLSLGGYHSCGLLADGSVICWGWNGYGQLGDGTLSSENHPVEVAAGYSFIGISLGLDHTCGVLAEDLDVRCWGYGNRGQLGIGNSTERLIPTKVMRGLLLGKSAESYALLSTFDNDLVGAINGFKLSTNLAADEWHHVALTYDKSSSESLFIDGALAYTNPIGVPISGESSEVIIGRLNNATIDEPRICNRAIPSGEMLLSYQSEFQRYNSSEWRYYANMTGLASGSYSYYGWASDSFGGNAQSETRTIDIVVPFITAAEPNTVKPVSSGLGRIDVSWDAGGNPEGTQYELYETTTAQTVYNGTALMFTHDGLNDNTRYCYTIRAWTGASENSWSAAVCNNTADRTGPQTPALAVKGPDPARPYAAAADDGDLADYTDGAKGFISSLVADKYGGTYRDDLGAQGENPIPGGFWNASLIFENYDSDYSTILSAAYNGSFVLTTEDVADIADYADIPVFSMTVSLMLEDDEPDYVDHVINYFYYGKGVVADTWIGCNLENQDAMSWQRMRDAYYAIDRNVSLSWPEASDIFLSNFSIATGKKGGDVGNEGEFPFFVSGLESGLNVSSSYSFGHDYSGVPDSIYNYDILVWDDFTPLNISRFQRDKMVVVAVQASDYANYPGTEFYTTTWFGSNEYVENLRVKRSNVSGNVYIVDTGWDDLWCIWEHNDWSEGAPPAWAGEKFAELVKTLGVRYGIYRANESSGTYLPVGGLEDEFSSGSLDSAKWQNYTSCQGCSMNVGDGILNLSFSEGVQWTAPFIRPQGEIPTPALLEFDVKVSAMGDEVADVSQYNYDLFMSDNKWYIFTRVNDTWFWRAYGGSSSAGKWYNVKLFHYGDKIRVLVNDGVDWDVTVDCDYIDYLHPSFNGLSSLTSGSVYYDNIRFTPLTTKDYYLDPSSPDMEPPDPPVISAATESSSSINVSWADPGDVGGTSYYYLKAFDGEGNEKNLASNGAFENGFKDWYYGPYAHVDTTEYYSGSSSVYVGYNDGAWAAVDQWKYYGAYEAGHGYLASFKYKCEKGAGNAGMFLGDADNYRKYYHYQSYPCTGNWESASNYLFLDADQPSNGSLDVYVYGNGATSGVYYDDIQLDKVENISATTGFKDIRIQSNASGAWTDLAYGTSTPYTLDGLDGNTRYHLRAYSRDNVLNENPIPSPVVDALTLAQTPKITHILCGGSAAGGYYCNVSFDMLSNAAGTKHYINETTGNTGATDQAWTADNSMYHDAGLAAEKQYCYRIRAMNNDSEESEYTAQVCGYVDTIPPAVRFVPPTKNSSAKITRNWTQVNMSIDEQNLDTFYFDWDYVGADPYLVGYWKFDGDPDYGENSTHAYDYSGGMKNATIYGATYVEGRKGLGLSFDGSSYVSVPTIEFYNRSFTVEAWIKENSLMYQQTFFAAQTSEALQNTIHIRIYPSGMVRFGFWGDDLDTDAGVVSAGLWTHIVATYDYGMDTSRIYVNGAQVASGNNGPFIALSPSLIIGAYEPGFEYFNGTIDEVRIYDIPLTSQQVLQRYQSTRAKYYDDSLVLDLNLDEGQNVTAADMSKYGNNATLQGGMGLNKFSDPGFEIDDDLDGLADDWQVWGGTSTYSLVDGVIGKAQKMNVTGGGGLYQPIDYTANRTYKVSLWLKVESGTVICGDLNSEYISPIIVSAAENGNQWKKYDSSGFVGTDPDCCFHCYAYDGPAVFYLDEARLEEVGWTDGKYGSGISFDGVDDYIDAGDSTSLNITNVLTIESWVKLANSVRSTVVGRGASGSIVRVYIFGKESNNKVLWIYSTDGSLENASGSILSEHTIDDNWHHIAVSFDSGISRLYIDGNLERTEVLNLTSIYSGSPEAETKIGFSNWGGGYLNGTIDEVRIYNRSLLPGEIWMDYQSNLIKYNSTEWRFYANLTNLSDGLYAYYGWANDTSGNSNQTDDGSLRYVEISANDHVPQVSNVRITDEDSGSIQLSVNDDILVYCNATVSDSQGYPDIYSVNATFYHETSSPSSADDYNSHYTDPRCVFTASSGLERNVSCAFTLHHEALSGNWTCRISAGDMSNNTGTGTGVNIVEELVSLSVLEGTVNFGSMDVGKNSSSAKSTNISNTGNMALDIRVYGNGDMSCSGAGKIGIGNISYSTVAGSYDSMSSKKLSTSPETESSFDLGVEGIASSEEVASSKNEYWTIRIPSGVSGTCNNTVTVLGIIDEGSVSEKFYVQNSSNVSVSSFSTAGNIILRGNCTAGGSCSNPPAGAVFLVQNSSNATVSYVDEMGNMCIQDASCTDYDPSCSSTGDDVYSIYNLMNVKVISINSSGNLCLTGELTQNGVP